VSSAPCRELLPEEEVEHHQGLDDLKVVLAHMLELHQPVESDSVVPYMSFDPAAN
jgi:hypothetical protein